MGSVIRPSGPLPARVYWTRRLLLLAVVVLAISLIWWVLGQVAGGADEPGADRSAGLPTGSATPPAETEEPGSATAATGGDGRGSGERSRARNGDEEKPNRRRPVLAEPTGACDPAEVAVEIVVSDAAAGRPNPADLVLQSLATPACTLAITPSSLALRVTSGNDVVWSSDHCPDAVLAKEIVVRRDPATTYAFTWDGHRSTESCSSPGSVARPGGYWVEAALVGADAHRAFFDVTMG